MHLKPKFYTLSFYENFKTRQILKFLYAITDETLTQGSSIKAQSLLALQGGAKFLQLRDKTSKDEDLLGLATDLMALCEKFGANFVVNDRLELACKINAKFLHIGLSDCDFSYAKKHFKGKIGVTCYSDLSLAKDMQEKGAAYLAFGSVFTSPTKQNAKLLDYKILEVAKKELDLPIALIGGITTENIKNIAKYGDYFCAINNLWTAPNIKKQAQNFCKILKGEE